MSTLHAVTASDAVRPLSREEAVAEAMQSFATELRLIDVSQLIYLCQADKHANINDLVESAAELFFQRNTLSYGGAAEVELHWETTPQIVLDMEFQHRQVIVFFRLRLHATGACVDICHVLFEDFSGPPAAATRLLVETLADAQLSAFEGVGALP